MTSHHHIYCGNVARLKKNKNMKKNLMMMMMGRRDDETMQNDDGEEELMRNKLGLHHGFNYLCQG